MGRTIPWILAWVLIPLAGCLEATVDSGDGGGSGTTQGGMFPGAKKEFSGAVGGTETNSHSFTVPSGSPELRVRAYYSVGGTFNILLKDPLGRVAEQDTGSGGQSSASETWHHESDPASGTWTLSITSSGGMSYSFGIFY